MSKKDLESIKRIKDYEEAQARLKMKENAFNADLNYNKYPGFSTYSMGVERRFNSGNTSVYGQVGGITGQTPSFFAAGIKQKF